MQHKLICLSNGDRFIEQFAKGSNLKIQDFENIPDEPVIFRGIVKKNLINERIINNKTFYFMDSGYVGNYPCSINKHGKKLYFRIVKNNLQHSNIIDRPDDRWLALQHPIEPWKKGDHILLVLPSEKSCNFYGVELNTWTDETITQIKKYTDRPIVVRKKATRKERVKNTIYQDLENAHALVTLNSIAAVESILFGVPAFTLAPTAADPVCDKYLSNIETPTLADDTLRYRWACHLAYGQYHIQEFKNGKALRMLNEDC